MKDSATFQQELDALDWQTPLRRARHAIARHVPLIAISCAVSLVLLAVYEMVFPPIYKAEATLMGEPLQDVIRNTYYANWDIFRKGDQKSEPALVTSGKVARETVVALGLKFNDVHHTFLTHVTYLWTDSWVGKRYRSFKEWLFPPDPSAYKPTQEEIDLARTVDAFKEGVSVEAVPGTLIANVVVKAPTYRAAEFANKVVDAYLAERTKMFRDEADMAYNSLEQEVKKAAAEIADLEQRKLDFDVENKVVLDFEKDKLLVGSWATLQTSINEVKSSIASLEASLVLVEEQLAAEPPEIVSAKKLQDSQVKGLLQAREFELRSSLQAARERFVPGSPEVTQLETLLAVTQAALQKEPDKVEVGVERIVNPVFSEMRQRRNNLLAQLASARAALAQKSERLAQLDERLDQVPFLVREVVSQARARDGLELRYKLLRERLMQAEVSRATIGKTQASVRVIEYASPPMKPIWPRNIILVPSALALGLFVGFALALLAEAFSPKVNRDRLASRPDLPVYAVIDLKSRGEPEEVGAARLEVPSIVDRLRRAS